MICLAEWDTVHFGIKVGEICVDKEECSGNHSWMSEEIAIAKKQGYRLLYFKGELPEECLSDYVVCLADEKMIFEKIVNSQNEWKQKTEIVSLLNRDVTEELIYLAYESGHCSRFKVDPRMPPSFFTMLYKKWITDSINGKIATDVLGYMVDNVPIGLLTYSARHEGNEIGLLAVAKNFARKGIGTELMKCLFGRTMPGDCVRVATQRRNKVACHFYLNNGFLQKDIIKIYHIWIQ